MPGRRRPTASKCSSNDAHTSPAANEPMPDVDCLHTRSCPRGHAVERRVQEVYVRLPPPVADRSLLLGCLAARAQVIQAPDDRPVSPKDVEHLRPAMWPDLRTAMSLGLNERIPDADLQSACKKECKFQYLSMGKLGTGITVSWNLSPAPNASLIALYLKRGSRFRRLYTGEGFGPEVIPGRPIPDLVVGTTTGACHEIFTRLRYTGRAYRPDACIQRMWSGENNCVAVPCGNGLPSFPDPYPEP